MNGTRESWHPINNGVVKEKSDYIVAQKVWCKWRPIVIKMIYMVDFGSHGRWTHGTVRPLWIEDSN